MNIIIVGAGEVGWHLAEELSGKSHNICVIESSEQHVQNLNDKLDVRAMVGTGTSVNTLEEADVAQCDLMLSLTNDDNTNFVAASMAKALGAKMTIARVHAGVQREEWLFDYKSHFQIDHLFSSERLAAVELAKFIRNPESLLAEEIARGRIELQRVQVSSKSKSVGRTLEDLKFPARTRIGLINRDGGNFIPSATDMLLPGDVVTIFGEPRRLTDVISTLQPSNDAAQERNVVIFGGTEAGFALAQMLEAGARYKVRVFDVNAKRCQMLAEQLQSTVIINADATSLHQLREERVGNADFFVAVTDDDEDNVMTCLQANYLGTKYCLAMIHRADYADAISRLGRQIGILGAVSPREASKRDLLRFVTEARYHLVAKLDDDAEVIQSAIGAKSRVAGKRISEVEWPHASGLVALLHGPHAIVPSGEDVINPGDTLFALVSKESKKAMVKLISS